MEANVFTYFVAIGSGVSFGLSLGAVPALLVYRWMTKKRGEGHAFKAQKSRS